MNFFFHVSLSFFFTAHLLPGICLIVVGYCGTSFILANVFLFLALGFNGAAAISNLSNNQDLSPNFAGFLYGIMNTVGATTGFIIPSLVEEIAGKYGVNILYIIISLCVCVCVCVAIFENIVPRCTAMIELRSTCCTLYFELPIISFYTCFSHQTNSRLQVLCTFCTLSIYKKLTVRKVHCHLYSSLTSIIGVHTLFIYGIVRMQRTG